MLFLPTRKLHHLHNTTTQQQEMQDLLSAIIATAKMTGSGVGLPPFLLERNNLAKGTATAESKSNSTNSSSRQCQRHPLLL
jgi:hypothetical protein